MKKIFDKKTLSALAALSLFSCSTTSSMDKNQLPTGSNGVKKSTIRVDVDTNEITSEEYNKRVFHQRALIDQIEADNRTKEAARRILQRQQSSACTLV